MSTRRPMVHLGDLMPETKSSLDPRKTPDEMFDLFSIPAFDAGTPEVVRGAEIGSAKQALLPGDVLLSKIVPHIRRACVVPSTATRRMIGSSEWIIFRSPRFDPAYLRHVLVTDHVHRAFMQTVAGVGGSLLRARPSYVAEIEIPLPPIEEQRRIASILDAADALRTKRRQALAKLDTLTQAIFIDMFDRISGDPSACSPLAELVPPGDRINYGVVQPGNDAVDGVPMIRVGDLVAGRVSHHAVKRIDANIDSQYSRSKLVGDEILLSCVGSTGVVALASPKEEGWNIARAVARIPLVKSIERDYVAAFLSSPIAQRYFDNELRTVSQPTLNIKQIKDTPVPIPPLRAQAEFAVRVQSVRQAQDFQRMSLDNLDALFATLQHRAFRGEL